MLDPVAVLSAVGGYVVVLFLLALWVERTVRRRGSLPGARIVYSLSLAVYCTSWTYYGSVGKAATSGFLFLTIYLGPTAGLVLWGTLMRRLVRIKERYRVTSVADLISVRYGKSQALAALATALALLGVAPYIALQLKSVNQTFALVAGGAAGWAGHVDLAVVVFLAVLTVVFGARRLDPTERHQGIMAVLAVECVVKLAAFLAVGLFVVYGLHHGFNDLFGRLGQVDLTQFPEVGIRRQPSYLAWTTFFLLSTSAVLFLPRQFHVLVVENSDENHLRTAAWLFPLYLLLINLFVYPIAAGGLLAGIPVSRADTYVLELPLRFGSSSLALFVFLGGFSAAAGMIVVSTMTLATMATNHLLMPATELWAPLRGLRRHLLPCRWAAMVAILLVGYAFQRLLGGSYMLVNMGMISFAAVLQFAPAVIAALFWKDANRQGALLGLGAGFGMWFYTLLLPALVKSGWLFGSLLRDGPWGLAALRPEQLFGVTGLDPLSHGVFWTLFANVGLLVAGSALTRQGAGERAVAEEFSRGGGASRASAGAGEATIPLADKVDRLQALFGEYYPEQKAIGMVQQALAESGLEGRDGIGPGDLAELIGCAERLLAGAVGPPAAHRAVREAGLYSREEAERIARAYSEMLAELMISPGELRQRVDYHQERSKLLRRQAATLEQKVREKEQEVQARARAERENKVLYIRQRALGQLLEVSMTDQALDLQLSRYLEVVFSLEEFKGLAKGAVLLADAQGESLYLAAHHGLDPELLELCARVPFGHCLCGAAAAERHTLFVDRVGVEHAVSFPGMEDHGHYCVPLLSEGRPLGVLNLYVAAGHPGSEGEVEFLEAVADTLTTLILKKRAEDAHQSTEKRLQAILDFTPAVVYVKDTEGRYLMVNRRFQELFGYRREELDGKSDFDVFPAEVAASFRVHDAEVIDLREPLEREEQVPRGDELRTYLSVKFPIFDEHGAVQGVCGISTDITDRKRAEEEVRRARDQLEVRVRERTAELQQAHQQMVQQEKLASIGQLAAGVAHEINNPLGFIRSNFGSLDACFEDLKKYLGALENKLAGGNGGAADAGTVAVLRDQHEVDLVLDDVRDIFDESADGFDRIIAIIQSLKNFSRIDRNPEMGPYDVNEAIESTLTVARNEIKYVAETETEFGEIPLIRANGQEINQVLLNLFVNAAQAIKGHRVGAMGSIRVSTRHAGSHVRIQIEDDGGGMPPEVQQRVFEPFYTTKNVGKGTGLGLSIAHDIVVNKHNGRISLQSEPGRGTTFTLELPVEQPAAEEPGAP